LGTVGLLAGAERNTLRNSYSLEPLLEWESAEMWFAVPGMYGGFQTRFEGEGASAELITSSWCRVAGGSGQRHRITAEGWTLIEEGFV
jgi:hypothetical protein